MSTRELVVAIGRDHFVLPHLGGGASSARVGRTIRGADAENGVSLRATSWRHETETIKPPFGGFTILVISLRKLERAKGFEPLQGPTVHDRW